MDDNSTPRRRPSTLARVAWVFLSLILWLWAVIGPVALAIRFFLWTTNSDPLGERESQELGTVAFLTLVGVSFAFLRVTKQLQFGDETCEDTLSSGQG